MPELENRKHERFCQEYAKDGNGARSYKTVYGEVKGASQSAKKLLERDDTQARLIEIRTDLAIRSGQSQDEIIRDLQAVYDVGMANPEKGGLSAAQNAKFQIAKILGYTDQRTKGKVEELSDEELVKQYREGTGNDRLADLMAAALKYSMGHDITADLDKIEAAMRSAAASRRGNGQDQQSSAAP